MTVPAPRIGLQQDVDVYSLREVLAGDALEQQFQMRSHAVQAAAPARPIVVSRLSAADTSPISFGPSAHGFQRPNGPGSAWLKDALQALAEVDEEIAEDGLPEITLSAKDEARRIVAALARHPWAPAVYPTQDAEVAIHFKSPDAPNSVVILLDSQGRGECYAYTGGRSRRAHYDVSTDLPDEFVRAQLRALMPERMARRVAPGGLDASVMMLLAGAPIAL
ncbi:MAG: hypothetical protein OXF27_12710 [Acidobacteria bacterium]|nr:hypothetical protein [Acidobacteriota bacterium]